MSKPTIKNYIISIDSEGIGGTSYLHGKPEPLHIRSSVLINKKITVKQYKAIKKILKEK